MAGMEGTQGTASTATEPLKLEKTASPGPLRRQEPKGLVSSCASYVEEQVCFKEIKNGLVYFDFKAFEDPNL